MPPSTVPFPSLTSLRVKVRECQDDILRVLRSGTRQQDELYTSDD